MEESGLVMLMQAAIDSSRAISITQISIHFKTKFLLSGADVRRLIFLNVNFARLLDYAVVDVPIIPS